MSRIVPSEDETKVEQRRVDQQEARDVAEATLGEPLAPDIFWDIQEFHRKFTHPDERYKGGPRELPDDIALFRIGFMVEELAEYAQASGFTNIARSLSDLHEHIKQKSRWVVKRLEVTNLEVQFDSLIDLVYVAVGTAHLHSVDFDEGWRRVHAANMSKVLARSAEESKRGYRYDVIKPKNWTPPDLSDLVAPRGEDPE